MEAAPPPPQRPPSDLSPGNRRNLPDRLRTADDLPRCRALESELARWCADLEASLADLARRLADGVAAHASRSEEAAGIVSSVRIGLVGLRSTVGGSSRDGLDQVGEAGRREQISAVELPSLAKEVARVQTVRAYAETALKLDGLIGDVEDAVSSSVGGKFRSPAAIKLEAVRMEAISTLKQIEDILTSLTRSSPQWVHLVSAVDHRVDRALAVLRPQAIADHRSLLASLGWPPPLSGTNIVHKSSGTSSELSNPLLLMTGEVKTKYFESFVSLCHLQELQRRRKSRQLEGYNLMVALRQPLWAIEELVNPVALACQHHFSKWLEKPEFIFALVYKIVRDFVDSIDEILQPLVDKAKLVGCSCREEWLSAMVTSLSTYLSKEVFPQFAHLLQSSNSNDDTQLAKSSWLQLIDLMISFDKRILSLIANSGLLLSLSEDEHMQRLSTLSVFCDRPDWLGLWAKLELGEMLEKTKAAIKDERNWTMRIQGTAIMSGSDDYKSPSISSALLQGLSLLIDRSRPLPSIELRAKFIRLAGAPILQDLLDSLLNRCQEAEGLTALADDEALLKVSNSVNAARYIESVLTEWCEGVFFVEMVTLAGTDTGQSSIFAEEIDGLKEFRTEWIDKISTVILRGFDALCRDYIKNKKQWQEKTEGTGLTRAIIGAIDYLQGKISKLEVGLNTTDFIPMWRNVATGVDLLLFSGVFLGGAKFSSSGVERLSADLEVLFGVFSAWCLRPQGFFPRLSEGLMILKMEEQQLKNDLLQGNDRALRENGIRHLTVSEVERIVKSNIR